MQIKLSKDQAQDLSLLSCWLEETFYGIDRHEQPIVGSVDAQVCIKKAQEIICILQTAIVKASVIEEMATSERDAWGNQIDDKGGE